MRNVSSMSRRFVVVIIAVVVGLGGAVGTALPARADLPGSHTFDGWQNGQLGNPDFLIAADSETRKDGPIAMRMDYSSATQGTGRYAHVFQDVLVSPGTTYRFTAWVKGEDVSAAGAFYFPLSADHLTRQEVPAGTFDWQQLTWEYTIPANQTSFRMRILGRGPGTVWFDQLTMTPTGSSQNLLANPSFDVFAQPPGALQFADETLVYRTGDAHVAVRTTADEVTWSLRADTGQLVTTGTATVVDGTTEIDLSDLAPGYYTVDTAVTSPQPATRSAGVAIMDPRSPQAGPDHPFGLSLLTRNFSVSALDGLLAPLGIGTARQGPSWADIEKVPGVYDFSGHADDQIQASIARGERPLVLTPQGNPLYDNGQTPASPEAIAAYARMVEAMARHYGDAVDYEVYNEFNHTANRGTCGKTPECYWELLEPTAAAIHRGAPNARVVGGGIAGLDVDWLDRLFELGALEAIDTVSFHAYDIPQAPEGETEAEVAALRTSLSEHGHPDMPIWMSEHGWHTQVGGVSEQLQNAYTLRSANLIHAAGVERIMYYSLIDAGLDPNEKEHNFGMVHSNLGVNAALAPKPAYPGFGVLNRVTAGREQVAVQRVGNAYVARWTSDELGDARVIWSPSGETLSLDLDDTVTVVEPMGREWSAGAGGRDLQLSVGEQPVYVVGGVTDVTATEPALTPQVPAQVAAGDDVPVRVGVSGTGLDVVGPVEVTGVVGESVTVAAGGSPATRTLTLEPFTRTGLMPWRIAASVDGGLVALALGDIDVVENPQLTVVPSQDPATGAGVTTLRATSLSGAATTEIGDIEWGLGERSGIASGGVVDGGSERSFELDRDLEPWRPVDYRVSTTVDGEARALSGRTVFAPVVPGGTEPDSRADWRSDAGWVSLGGATPDADDLGGKFHLSADDDGLTITAEVTDDDHNAGPSASQLWAGDSIQFAVSPGLPGSSTERAELGAALMDDGPAVYRFTSPAGTVAGAAATIERDEDAGATSYVITVDWDELGVDPEAGLFSFSAVLNDNDEGTRAGYYEWGSGIGGRKDTSLFLPVTMVQTPAVSIETAAVVRCRGRSAALEVTITNTGERTAEVRAVSELGDKKHRALAPGKSVTLGFPKAETDGTVEVSAYVRATDDAPAAYTWQELDYTGKRCQQ